MLEHGFRLDSRAFHEKCVIRKSVRNTELLKAYAPRWSTGQGIQLITPSEFEVRIIVRSLY